MKVYMVEKIDVMQVLSPRLLAPVFWCRSKAAEEADVKNKLSMDFYSYRVRELEIK